MAKAEISRLNLRYLYEELEIYRKAHARYPERISKIIPFSINKLKNGENRILSAHSDNPTLNDPASIFYFYRDEKFNGTLPLAATYRSFKSNGNICHLVLWTDGRVTNQDPEQFDEMVLMYNLGSNEVKDSWKYSKDSSSSNSTPKTKP